MKKFSCVARFKIAFSSIVLLQLLVISVNAQVGKSFKVIAFYTGREDQAHISFMQEANPWFSAKAKENHFSYDTTTNWNNMNDSFLAKYQVVIFLDTRPDSLPQRMAFEKFMKNGGAWMGFHFSAFALTPSAFRFPAKLGLVSQRIPGCRQLR